MKALIFLVIAGAAGWWVYQNVFESESVSAPSCKAQLSSCMANCRKTTTEAPAAQACQEACQRAAASCDKR